MSNARAAAEVLNRDFLELRARILDLAAALDRVDRASVSPEPPEPRIEQLRQGIELLLTQKTDRAEAVQLHFSYKYDPDWRERFGVVAPRSR